jgi:hypothetical protein
MKTIALMIALAGFTAFTCGAQDKKNCCCKHKVTRQKMAVNSKKSGPVDVATGVYTPSPFHQPDDNLTKLTTGLEQTAMENLLDEPCYTYRQHNIVVTECPGVSYDDAGNMYYSTQGVYMGNYPKHSKTMVRQQTDNEDNFKGRAPSGDNLCYKCK